MRTPAEIQADQVMEELLDLEYSHPSVVLYAYESYKIREKRNFLGLVHRCPDIETAVLLQDMQSFGGST